MSISIYCIFQMIKYLSFVIIRCKEAEGSLFTTSYVSLSESRDSIFVSYVDLSIITVALPLSARRIDIWSSLFNVSVLSLPLK